MIKTHWHFNHANGDAVKREQLCDWSRASCQNKPEAASKRPGANAMQKRHSPWRHLQAENYQ
jgi:hypothetical protein